MADSEEPKPIPTIRGIGELLLSGTLQIGSVLGGGLSVIAGILTSVFLPGETMPLWVGALVGFILLWLCAAALSAMLLARSDAQALHEAAVAERARYERERAAREADRLRLEQERARPVVEAAVEPFEPYQSAVCIFIVRWPASTALPMGAAVIISTAEATHERPLGTGCVRVPQQDGRHVVTLDQPGSGAAKFITALLAKDTHDECVKRLRIGPGYDLQNLSAARVPPGDAPVTPPPTTSSASSSGSL